MQARRFFICALAFNVGGFVVGLLLKPELATPGVLVYLAFKGVLLIAMVFGNGGGR
jgi:hypothetical protein